MSVTQYFWELSLSIRDLNVRMEYTQMLFIFVTCKRNMSTYFNEFPFFVIQVSLMHIISLNL